jgi:hypothetical protein
MRQKHECGKYVDQMLNIFPWEHASVLTNTVVAILTNRGIYIHDGEWG